MNKYSIPTLLLLISSQVFGQTGDFDRTYQTRTIYNQATQTSSSDPTKINQMITYSGIYGRTEQTKILNYAPDGSVLIQPIIYDEYGNIDKNYLPYTHTSGAAYDNNVITNQGKFYQNTPLVAHDDYPYTSVEYDRSPSNFIRSGKAVGTFWQDAVNPTNKLLAQKITNTVFDANNVDLSGNMYAIRKWDETVSNGFYAPNELSGYVSSSPEHATEVTFSDKSGRIICKRTLNTAANKLLTTFYVYNDLGKLAYVIPPKAYYQLELIGTFDITLVAEELIFQYTYDEKGRLIEKKIPGKEKIEIVYDNLNRVILQQDGNLRTQNKWFLYRYDAINRPLIVGTYVNNSTTSRAAMQSAADTHYSSGANSEVRDGTNFSAFMGYSNQSFPLLTTSPSNFEILTVNYYDDYDFNLDGTDDVSYIQHIQEHNPAFNNKNRLTKTKSKKIGGTGYLSEIYFYQFNTGELIQTQSDNSLGGLDLTNYESNFLGQPVRIEHHRNYGGLDYHFIKNRYTYDHQNRLIKSYEQIDNDPEIVLSEYAYNQLGQPIIKKLHSENDNGSYLQNVNYAYHINGGVTKINNATTLGILDPIELIATFSSNAVIDIVYTSDATFLGNVDLAKYITTVGLEDYQFRVDEIYVRGGGKYLELSYTDNKEFTINSDLSLPTSETAIVTSTESYKEQLLTYVSGSLLYSELQKLNMATIDITFTTPVTDFSGTAFYDDSRAQIATQLATYGVTDSIAITYLTDKVVAKLTTNVQKFYNLNTENDLFAMDILYDNPQFSNGVAKHNGNISEVHWKSKSDEIYRGYTYFYDDIEQLTTAYYAEYNTVGGGWNSQINLYTVANITHDHNGNIETLYRKGYKDDGTFGHIDLLSYTYLGNQLITVDDAIQGVAITDDFDDNGSFGGTEFTYDANGNIIADANKGITISYNILNLPEMITFTDGNQLHYMYSAKGTLLERQITHGMLSGVLHQYSGRFKYEDNVLTAITNAEGRAVPDVSNGTDFRYEYNYTDQVGNVRLTFSDLNGNGLVNQDEIIQETHYYPFGGKLNGLNTVQIGPENHFKFNGNELHSDNGLNWYNFNARFYMPELGRFANADPLAELATDWTPYRFAFNNPISLNDPTGLFEGYDYDDYGDDDRGDDDRGGRDDDRGDTPFRDLSWGCIECEQEDRGRDTYYDYDEEYFDMEFNYDLLEAYDYGGDGYDGGEYETSNFSYDYDGLDMDMRVNRGNSQLSYGANTEQASGSNSIGYTLTFGGGLYYAGENIVVNGNKWLGKNGKYYSKSWGGNGYTASRSGALKVSNAYKIAGRKLFFIGAFVSGYEGIDNLRLGNTEGAVSSGLDIVLGGFMTFGGPIGFFSGGFATALKFGLDNGYLFESTYTPNWSTQGICFIAGTEILMSDGLIKNIENVVVGDSVLTYNLLTKKVETNVVLQVDNPMHIDLVEISFSNGLINTNTPDHPYYVKGKGWSSVNPKQTQQHYKMTVEQLEKGDVCLFYDRKNKIILEIFITETVVIKENTQTYNLSKIANNNNYFANGILVHNKYNPEKENNDITKEK